MKEEFFGFYTPTEAEINNSWTHGTFIFDANVLLNLYRYSEPTSRDFLLSFEKLKERTFLPYQAGFEFHSNRNSVIEGMNNSYAAFLAGAKDVIEKNFQNLVNQYKRHPSIEIDKFEPIQAEFIKKIATELDHQKKSHPDLSKKDEILDKLTIIFKGKVGKAFSRDELKKIYSEGKERYDNQIPPGYKDQETKKGRGEQNLYGDLIIWQEIISYASKYKKDIILVTDDRKEDWWTKENGRTLGPRQELIKEFHDLTKLRILIYNADQFLGHAKTRRLVDKIKSTSISEVQEVRKSDEIQNAIRSLSNYVNQHKLETNVPYFDLASNKELWLLGNNYSHLGNLNSHSFYNFVTDKTLKDKFYEEVLQKKFNSLSQDLQLTNEVLLASKPLESMSVLDQIKKLEEPATNKSLSTNIKQEVEKSKGKSEHE